VLTNQALSFYDLLSVEPDVDGSDEGGYEEEEVAGPGEIAVG
jgi:hypothetical protein